MKLDIYNGSSDKIIVFEGDNLLESEVITLIKDDKVIDLTGLTCDMGYVDINTNNGDIIENLKISSPTEGKIELPINSSLTKKDGIYDCELRLKSSKDDYVKFTAFFSLIVKANVFNKIGNGILKNDSFSKIQFILDNADKHKKLLEDKISELNETVKSANDSNITLNTTLNQTKKLNTEATSNNTSLKENITKAEDLNKKLEDNSSQFVVDEEKRKENEAERIEAEKVREEKINEFGSQVTKIENDFDEVIANVTNGNENATNSEIVQARGKSVNLGARLDGIDSQLSDNENKEFHRALLQTRRKKAIMTLIDDDGREHVYRLLKPVIEELQVPITLCLITDRVESGNKDWLNLNQVMELKGTGLFELCSHTASHMALSQHTEEEQRKEMRKSKEMLKKYALCDDIIVYPYGSVDCVTRRVAKEFYRAGVWIDNGEHLVNYSPIDTYHLQRVYIENSVELCKKKIDEAIENDGWVIFGMHCHYDNWRAEDLKAIVNYAKIRGIEIVSLSEGLNRYGNIIEFGDTYENQAPNTFALGCDGKSKGQDLGKVIYRVNGLFNFEVTPNTPITYFQKGKITITHISYARREGFPENKGGTLKTYNLFLLNDHAYARQEYEILDENTVYIRIWDRNNNMWLEWEKQNNVYIKSLNSVNNTTPIKAFKKGVTVTHVNIAGGKGFPNDNAGILITYKIGGNGWDYQEFSEYNSDGKWKRYVLSSGEFSSWTKLNLVEKKNISLPDITIPANGQTFVDVPFRNASPSESVVSATPSWSISGSLLYNVFIDESHKIKLSIRNFSSSDKTISARVWKFMIAY